MNTVKAMEDPEDLGLKAVMGERFRDCTKGGRANAGSFAGAQDDKGFKDGGASGMPRPTKRTEGAARDAANTGTEKGTDASWEPVASRCPKVRTEVEVLKSCTKAMLPFSVICPVLLYWQTNGLLDPKAAEVSLLICALLAGLRVGHAAGKGC